MGLSSNNSCRSPWITVLLSTTVSVLFRVVETAYYASCPPPPHTQFVLWSDGFTKHFGYRGWHHCAHHLIVAKSCHLLLDANCTGDHFFQLHWCLFLCKWRVFIPLCSEGLPAFLSEFHLPLLWWSFLSLFEHNERFVCIAVRISLACWSDIQLDDDVFFFCVLPSQVGWGGKCS